MSLNIKNAESERLAKELAERTGETLTGAVTTALRERLERIDRDDQQRLQRRLDHLMAIAHDAGPRWKEPYRSKDHGQLLYDDLGLPR